MKEALQPRVGQLSMDRSNFMTDAAESCGRIHFHFDCAPAAEHH